MEKSGITMLANMFKQNENRQVLGPMLAEVVEPMPNIKIKLLNGKMELNHEIDAENLFISETLTNRINIDVTFKDFESKGNTFKNGVSTGNQYKNLTADGGTVTHPAPVPDVGGKSANGQVPPAIASAQFTSGNIAEIKTPNHKNEQENKKSGKLKAQFLVTLKKGDKVLVLPNDTEDQFFIIDIFHNVKEVKDKWEYYQKS